MSKLSPMRTVVGPGMNGPNAQLRFRMLRPTDNLRADHQVIALGARLLQAIADHVRTGAPLPADDTALVLRFLRDFVLAVHMRKEAEALWPAVAMRGDDACAGMVGELLRLHEEITTLTHSLVLFWEPIEPLSADEQRGFAETVDQVCARLARIAELEEQCLFPACDASVPADDQLDWVQQFQQLEHERGGCQQWERSLQPLAARWPA
jgi:hemerythrin-like domain-containing protein